MWVRTLADYCPMKGARGPRSLQCIHTLNAWMIYTQHLLCQKIKIPVLLYSNRMHVGHQRCVRFLLMDLNYKHGTDGH